MHIWGDKFGCAILPGEVNAMSEEARRMQAHLKRLKAPGFLPPGKLGRE
jgi:hypothetical protein